jgi:hypothetical protein
MGTGSSSRGPAWATAAELGEYAFCPRAWHYRAHPPPGEPSAADLDRERYGVRFHERALSRQVARERSYAGLAALAALLLLGGILLLLILQGIA